jgi:hypothetical protein
MSNLIPFEQAAVPAHIQAAFGEQSNIPEKQTIPQLSFRGKVWRIVINNEETPLMRKDPDSGESIPASVIPLVILDFTKARSRAYYEGAYEEGKKAAPRCRSQDGKVPDADVKEKMAPTCASCPMSVKGSKVDGDKQLVACTTFKNLAVVPGTQIDKFPPLRLRLAQTSIWDKENAENEAQGWYAFDQFVDFIRGRGVQHTGQILVKAKFDTRVAHPKLLFKADAWLDEGKVMQVKKVLESKLAEIQKALSINEEVNHEPAAPATPTAPAHEAKAAVQAPAAAAPATPKKNPVGRPPNPPKAVAAPKPPADDGDPFAAAGAKSEVVRAVPPEKVTVIPAGNATPEQKVANLAGLLGEWDE